MQDSKTCARQISKLYVQVTQDTRDFARFRPDIQLQAVRRPNQDVHLKNRRKLWYALSVSLRQSDTIDLGEYLEEYSPRTSVHVTPVDTSQDAVIEMAI